jgi:hypothetical protein
MSCSRLLLVILASTSTTCGAFHASPSRLHLRTPSSRCHPLCLGTTASPSFVGVEQAETREATVQALEHLKAAGTSRLWDSFRLSPRAVSLSELCRTTKVDEKSLDPNAVEFELSDIQNTFIKVLIGSTLAATVWAFGSDAIGLDAGLRFTGTYLIAGVPLAVVAIGSVAPGILFLPVEAFLSLKAGEDEKASRMERVCKHEASHLLTAYVLGLPIDEVCIEAATPRVVVYDEELVQRPGRLIDSSDSSALAVVAVSGLVAEAVAYGKALGASADLELLNKMLLQTRPPLPAGTIAETTRYAALMAWSILQKHSLAYDAIAAALQEGKGLAECLEAAEEAERSQAEADAAAKVARAESIAKETPQERAARERAEDAARRRK